MKTTALIVVAIIIFSAFGSAPFILNNEKSKTSISFNHSSTNKAPSNENNNQ